MKQVCLLALAFVLLLGKSEHVNVLSLWIIKIDKALHFRNDCVPTVLLLSINVCTAYSQDSLCNAYSQDSLCNAYSQDSLCNAYSQDSLMLIPRIVCRLYLNTSAFLFFAVFCAWLSSLSSVFVVVTVVVVVIVLAVVVVACLQ
jgi:hypothetical protein